MYLSKHQGGNSVSSVEQGDPNDTKRWKKDVLEAYLGVTLKRLVLNRPGSLRRNLPPAGTIHPLTYRTRSVRPGHEIPPAVVDTVTSLALAIDAKDHYTQGHSQKVSAYAVMIAQALNMNQEEVEEIRLAGLLHDIGKVGIPEIILEQVRPARFRRMGNDENAHALGAKILEPLEAMNLIRLMVRHHHEFYDGTGYPDRLRWREDPLWSAGHRDCRRLRYDHVRTHLQEAAHARKKRFPSCSAVPPLSSIPKSSACSSKPCAALRKVICQRRDWPQPDRSKNLPRFSSISIAIRRNHTCPNRRPLLRNLPISCDSDLACIQSAYIFEVKDASGNREMDGRRRVSRRNAFGACCRIRCRPETQFRARAMEMLLGALGSCSAVDVVVILEKKRRNLDRSKLKFPESARRSHQRSGRKST